MVFGIFISFIVITKTNYTIKEIIISKQYLPMLFLLLTSIVIWKIWKSISVYTYSYRTPFPILFVIDPIDIKPSEGIKYSNNAFFHVKLFIIDEEIAFLGSINLTTKGMKYNVESCITIEDIEVVKKLSNFYNELMMQDYYQVNIEYWGKLLYSEPIN